MNRQKPNILLCVGLLLNSAHILIDRFVYPLPEVIRGMMVGASIALLLLSVLPESARQKLRRFKLSLIGKNKGA